MVEKQAPGIKGKAKEKTKGGSKTLGPLIAKVISRQAMKQNELSRRLGMTPSQISNFLNGNKDIHSTNLVSMLQILGIDMVKILRSQAGTNSSLEENLESQLKILPPVERNTLGEFVRIFHDRFSEEKKLKTRKADTLAE